VGEYDVPDVHAHAGAIASGIEHAKRKIVHGAGHLVPLERSEEFTRLIYDFLDSNRFFLILHSQGVAAAVDFYRSLHERDPEVAPFTERDMNDLGYRYLTTGKIGGAIELFKLNVLAYPNSFNVYDSLAEAYMTAGETERAVEYYRKSLEINPDNTNATNMLRELGEQ